MKLCKKCANEVKDSATVCPNCGATFNDTKEVITKSDINDENNYKYENNDQPFMNNGLVRGPYKKWISLTLCILLGWLGAHKFYEGKFYVGVFYAVTIGFFGIGIVLDLIRLIKKPKNYYVSIIPFM